MVHGQFTTMAWMDDEPVVNVVKDGRGMGRMLGSDEAKGDHGAGSSWEVSS